jgi:hypothetical protein
MCAIYVSLATSTAGYRKMIYDERNKKKSEFYFSSEELLWRNVIKDTGKIDSPYQYCKSDFKNKIFKKCSLN